MTLFRDIASFSNDRGHFNNIDVELIILYRIKVSILALLSTNFIAIYELRDW